MHRGEIGRYEVTRVENETVRAFVPNPLPPEPPLRMDGTLQQVLEQATLAVGRLDSVTALLPDPDIFIYSYVRKEAVLSGQIEGTRSTLSDCWRSSWDKRRPCREMTLRKFQTTSRR